MFAVGYGIGPTGTNNIAEAIAFIVGADKVMEMAREHVNLDAEGRNKRIYALLDSQIVVDMLNGKSMPRHPTMRKLMQIARRFADDGIEIMHVRRTFNQRAD